MATPSKRRAPRQYHLPRSGSRLFLLSVLAAAGVLGLAIAMHMTIWPAAAAPGPVASAHAPIETSCAVCHTPRHGATDAKCERCHDPLMTSRFAPSAHAAAGIDAKRMQDAEAMTCASCHVEHRGRAVVLRTADDGTCRECHALRSFGAHPEFAVVRAGNVSTVGLNFSHMSHLKTLASSASTARCESCHEPETNRERFQPISFDRHCSSCHVKPVGAGGRAVLTIDGTTALESLGVDADALMPDAGSVTLGEKDGRGRRIVRDMVHRDAWIIARAFRLGRVIDPSLGLRDRQNQEASVARADAATSAAAMGSLGDAQLREWADATRAEITAIDRQLKAAPGTLDANGSALLAQLTEALAVVDSSLRSSPAPVEPAAAASDPAAQRADYDARRAELAGLLTAIENRGDEAAKKAAAAIRSKLAALTPDASTAADTTGLANRLQNLETLLRRLEPVVGPRQLGELRDETEETRLALATGIDGATFRARQAEILKLLTAADARTTDPVLRLRIAGLRDALRRAADNIGEAALERRRATLTRLLERITVQRELLGQPGAGEAFVRQDMRAVASHATTVGAELNQMPALLAPALAITDTAGGRNLKALLDGCLTCHRLNADGSGFAPVRPALGEFAAAKFSHKPHVTQGRCETCHAGVETSSSPLDSLIPGVESCRTCHQPGQAGTKCVECHAYHLSLAAVLKGGRQ